MKCSICKKAEGKIQTDDCDFGIYLCVRCLSLLNDNFALVCVNCKRVYIRNKEMFLRYAFYEDLNLYHQMKEVRNDQRVVGLDYCDECEGQTIQ